MTWAGLWILISCGGEVAAPERPPPAPPAAPEAPPAAPEAPPAAPEAPAASCPLPTPTQALRQDAPDFAPYQTQLQQAGITSDVDKGAASDDGHVSSAPALSIHAEVDLRDCWPPLRALLGLPEGLEIPAEGPSEQEIENPSKPAWAWSDGVTVTRSDAGVQSVRYFLRGEGGGVGAWVRASEGGLQLSIDAISD